MGPGSSRGLRRTCQGVAGCALAALIAFAGTLCNPGLLPTTRQWARMEAPPSTTATPAALRGKAALEGSSPSQMTCRLHAREAADPAWAPQLSWACTMKLSSVSPHAMDALAGQALSGGS